MTWIKQSTSLISYMTSKKKNSINDLASLSKKRDLKYQTCKEFEMINWVNLIFAIRTTLVFSKDKTLTSMMMIRLMMISYSFKTFY